MVAWQGHVHCAYKTERKCFRLVTGQVLILVEHGVWSWGVACTTALLAHFTDVVHSQLHGSHTVHLCLLGSALNEG